MTKQIIIKYFFVSLGCLIMSSAINLFFVPHKLLSGGVTGIAVILFYLFRFPIGISLLLMNIPLLYAAYRLLGRGYATVTIYGVIFFSIAVDALSFLTTHNPIANPILAAITGGLISGIGAGLVFRVNGSSGGLDIISGIVKKYLSYNMGTVGFAVNCMIMILAAALFGLEMAVLTLLSMFVTAIVTDKVVAGFNHRKMVYIISYQADSLAQAIIREVGRGATILHGTGAFTKQDKRVIFVVVNLTQISKIKTLVNEVDPYAFIIVQDATEVMGRGFSILN